MRLPPLYLFVVWLGLSTCVASLTPNLAFSQAPSSTTVDSNQVALMEGKLLGDIRQLTFEGRRAGEGYFSADGTRMVFQSE